MFSVYIEFNTKGIFAVACLGKKLVFQTEICDLFTSVIFKYSFFDRVKELSKFNQTRYGVSPVYIESKTKRIFAIAWLGKKLVFQSELSTYSLIIRLFFSFFDPVKECSKSH